MSAQTYFKIDAVEEGNLFTSLKNINTNLENIITTLKEIDNKINNNPSSKTIVRVSETEHPDVLITGTLYPYVGGETIEYTDSLWTYAKYGDETKVENSTSSNVLYFATGGYILKLSSSDCYMISLETIVKTEGNYTPARTSDVLTEKPYAVYRVTDSGVTFKIIGYIDIKTITIN